MVSVSRLTLACLAGAAILAGAAGCSGLDEANAAGVTHDDLVSDLTAQLAGAAGLTYTATYLLAGGESATITQSQKPLRTAYTYPGGRTIVTAAGTIRCKGTTCKETDPSPDDAITVPGLETPESVIALLNQAALNSSAVPAVHDTTVAGHNASCLTWPSPSAATTDPASAESSTGGMSVCATSEGALGSFTDTVGQIHTEMALTAYTDKADPAAFTLPASAKLTAHRSTK